MKEIELRTCDVPNFAGAFRGLTVHQPYANLICSPGLEMFIGAKYVENRTYCPAYRGWVFIHAGNSQVRKAECKLYKVAPRAYGAVVGVARLMAAMRKSAIGDLGRRSANPFWARVHKHYHTEGPCCWVWDTIWRLRSPVAWSGQQSLWFPGGELIRQVKAQFTAATLVHSFHHAGWQAA